MIFDAGTEDGPEKIEINISGETKVFEGVTTLAYLDTLHKDRRIYEYKQRLFGSTQNDWNVWYFGEEVDNFDSKGNFKDHASTFNHSLNPIIYFLKHFVTKRFGRQSTMDPVDGLAESTFNFSNSGSTYTQ